MLCSPENGNLDFVTGTYSESGDKSQGIISYHKGQKTDFKNQINILNEYQEFPEAEGSSNFMCTTSKYNPDSKRKVNNIPNELSEISTQNQESRKQNKL